tara:strand:+ start:736 stop:966 length:231 start_codon:yes stop_codon:yes gene_type:complete
MSILNSKRFVVRQSLIGKNQVINVEFKNGKTFKYNHDKVFSIMKDNLTKLNCWEKYKSYTSSTSIPRVLQGDVEVL